MCLLRRPVSVAGSWLRLIRACMLFESVAAKLTYTNLDEIEKPVSLADGFKTSLVRPPDEAPNSGSKTLVNVASIHLLEDQERNTLDEYDAIFEKYSMFCNGRWLGAQVLQDSQDLMYLQHIVYMKKPDIIIETGTYKGGLTYFFASLLDWIDRDGTAERTAERDTKILSVDRHHPDMVFAANWFCPVCIDCIKPYKTDVWDRKVRFLQGLADSDEVYFHTLEHLHDLGYLVFVEKETGRVLPVEEAAARGALPIPSADASQGQQSIEVRMQPAMTVVVNLDANHEYDGLMRELFFYGLMVSENSYLIVQDVKLDKIWGTAGPTAAVEFFLNVLPEGEFVAEHELKFHGYSQHMYLRRARVTVGHTYLLDRAHELERHMKEAGAKRAET
eukprot:TRINITY_DN102733_c0_g1_i1.p1 TRINITY_DN102733_c0_g1~~TRINITY_DN102733_c0_g1_i1.p1  ORF type:complete len:389 (+),score=84.48 TRINITY_DN102733_c0_g1_i1:107-1273(+)